MKRAGVVVENLSIFNPFKVFGLAEVFEINKGELDSIYFQMLRNSKSGLEEINEAYNDLIDDEKRAKALCDLNGHKNPDGALAKEMLGLFMKKEKINPELIDLCRSRVIEYSKANDWAQAWYYIQRLSYLRRIASQ
jgi:hypothetical protein